MKKVARLRQLFRWLQLKYPTPYPVSLRLTHKRLVLVDPETGKKEVVYGVTWASNKRIEVVASTRYPLPVVEETLLHEYTHATELRHAKIENSRRRVRAGFHDNHFWLAYGEHYRDFYERGGYEESRKA